MDVLLQELENYYNSGDSTNVKESLEKIISESSVIELTASDAFELLLKSKSCDILLLSVQCIAELAKQEENRKILTKEEIITRLIEISVTEENQVYHSFRALGNITYENDNARNIIGATGVQTLISKVHEVANSWIHKHNPKLISVLCGCLLNILTCNDMLQKVALNNGIVHTIQIILNKTVEYFQDQEDCITYVLQLLSFVCDHMIDEWLSEDLCSVLVNIIQVSENAEISVLCLEILRQQSDNDDLKFSLAKLGTCELVYDLVEKYGNQVNDEDSRSALKLACDLIVLILTGDEAMKYLYDKSNGKVYHQMISWIDCQDLDLVSTGILAIGNFARNDVHCIHMVQSGLSKRLIDLLAMYNQKDVDMKIQHAILSTLRHLSIPVQNKSQLIEENIVEVLYSMINIGYYPVIFKLMGTFRMLVDGQESTARALISRKELIEKIVYWCYNSDHLGVRAEAPRLLVWLIKNSHSAEAYPMILSVPNSVKCLVEMITSLHAVMQNEAILALNLICSCYFMANDNERPYSTVTEQVNNMKLVNTNVGVDSTYIAELLIAADIAKNIAFIINKYHEKMAFETGS
ncbi:Armadillo repeat containing protein, partial [Oryctes borbonicus]